MAFAVFNQYLAAGPTRTLRQTMRDPAKPEGYTHSVQQWSIKFGWKMRAHAYDKRIVQAQHDAAIEAAKQKGAMMGRIVDGLWLLGGQALEAWDLKIREHLELARATHAKGVEVPVPPITPGELQKLVNTGVQLSNLLDE